MAALPAFRIVSSEDDLQDSPPPGPDLDDLLTRYLRLHPAVSGAAARQYGIAVNLALAFLCEGDRGRSCDALFCLESLCDFFRWLGPGKQRSAATANGRLDVLWMLWAFADDEKLCREPLPRPSKKPRIKEDRQDPVALTLDQITLLQAACLRAPPMRRVNWWSADHWLSLVCVYLATGERFQALLRCPRSALTGSVFLVPAQLTKDKKEQPVVIPAWIADKIRALPPIDGSELIWPYPFALDQLRERYTEDILKPGGLPYSRRHKFHCLRRTAVTQVRISQGLEKAREMVRHFGATITEERYVSKAVMQQQVGSVSFAVPNPSRRQGRLFE